MLVFVLVAVVGERLRRLLRHLDGGHAQDRALAVLDLLGERSSGFGGDFHQPAFSVRPDDEHVGHVTHCQANRDIAVRQR